MMRVGIIAVDRRPGRVSVLVPEMVARLRALGALAEVIDPDAAPIELGTVRCEADLYILKSGTEAALSFAGALDSAGARIVNPYPVAGACRDKIIQTRVLAAAGIPVPRSWLTTDPRTLVRELDGGPLIVKDPRGSQGRGLTIAHRPEDLAAVPSDRPWLAMRYHQPDGPDLKLYRIGEHVFGVERNFPARTYAEKVGRPVDVPDHVRDIVLRCGDAFGIRLYGVDIICAGGQPWVVDMSSFPGFKGVPDAGSRIADHIWTSMAPVGPVPR